MKSLVEYIQEGKEGAQKRHNFSNGYDRVPLKDVTLEMIENGDYGDHSICSRSTFGNNDTVGHKIGPDKWEVYTDRYRKKKRFMTNQEVYDYLQKNDLDIVMFPKD